MKPSNLTIMSTKQQLNDYGEQLPQSNTDEGEARLQGCTKERVSTYALITAMSSIKAEWTHKWYCMVNIYGTPLKDRYNMPKINEDHRSRNRTIICVLKRTG